MIDGQELRVQLPKWLQTFSVASEEKLIIDGISVVLHLEVTSKYNSDNQKNLMCLATFLCAWFLFNTYQYMYLKFLKLLLEHSVFS
jgi:hypothetical protein